MPYYDKLIQDPETALADAAERRGETREDMNQRLNEIRQRAAVEVEGDHLSLSQAQNFLKQSWPVDIQRHVDECGYCQGLLNAINPEAIEDSLEQTFRKLRDPNNTVRPLELANVPNDADGVTALSAPARTLGMPAISAIAATIAGVAFSIGLMLKQPDAANFSNPNMVAIAEYNELSEQLVVLKKRLEAQNVSVVGGNDEGDWVVVEASHQNLRLQRSENVDDAWDWATVSPGDVVAIELAQQSDDETVRANPEPAISN